MKMLKATLASILITLSLSGLAQEKYSRVKVYTPADPAARAEILGQLEIDHYVEADGAIISEVSASTLSRYRQSRTASRIEILSDDVAKELQEENVRFFEARRSGRLALESDGSTVGQIITTPSAFQVYSSLGGYYSFAQMNTAMNNLVAAYPSIASKSSLGKSTNGNDIWCIKISDNVAVDENNEPEVLYIGLQHAREAIGGSSMIFFMQYLCEQYAINPSIKDLVDNREIFIIPCMNPDGWEYNRTSAPNGGGGWRKNRRRFGSNYGVDLNRNWGIDWGNCSGATSSCGSSSSSSETYYGPSAFSEAETQVVRDFTYSRHFVAMIDQHAYGPYYSIPFGRPSLHTMSALDDKFYTYVPAAMGTYNGMRAGNSPNSVGYEVAGGVKDWMLMGNIGTGTKGKVYGMTGEGGAGGGTGGTYGNFWAPAAQIVNLCKGMTFQNLQLAYSAGSYVNLQERSPMNLTAKSGNIPFFVRRVGLEDKPVTVTLIPIENFIAGPSVTINSLPNYYDSYSGTMSYTLPAALTSGQRVKYAWRIETGGYTYYDTITRFYNPVIILQDNMESGSITSNWTRTGSWNYSTDDAFNGSRSLTESPGGNYAANTTSYARNNNVINLSDATAANISFYTHYAAENFRDKLQLQISTNNGGSWTAIAGSTTIQEPYTYDGSTIGGDPSLTGIKEEWTYEIFDLSDYLGNANVQFRFYFTSNAASSFWKSQDDGFYIDDLMVIKSTNALTTLPVQFESFNAWLQADGTGLLKWEASFDDAHDHFEVEKSTDGFSFHSIGRTERDEAMTFTDRKLRTGNNYYRIKQIDQDGHVTYSSIRNIWVEAKLKASLSPNPVTDRVSVQLQGLDADVYQLRVTDMNGRLFYTSTLPGSERLQVEVSMAKAPAQLYLFTIENSLGQLIYSQKFIKQ